MTTHHTSGAADLPEALRPVEPGALFASIQELNAWEARADGELLTQAEGESIILVLHELKRLIALAAGQAVATAEPTPDKLRAIAREARNSSGSASDDCGSAKYVLYGWLAAMSRVAPPAMDGGEDAAWLLRQILAASQDGDSDTRLSAHFVSRIETITKPGGAA